MSHPVHQAPLAVTCDGALLVNLHHVHGDSDPARLLELGSELGSEVFVAIVADRNELKLALARLDDAATDIAAHVLGTRMRRMKHPSFRSRRRRP